MKKLMMFTAAASLGLFFIVSVAHAQGGLNDLGIEGQGVVAASKYMMAQAQKIKAAVNDKDRAWMVDEGHKLLTHGNNYIQAGVMDSTDAGIRYMQQIGRKLRDAGNVLLTIGRKQGPLTQKEKDEINNMADVMQGLGTEMLSQGQMMGG
jgi:hypothetical protein